jgi:conjugative transfer signal peptidase TraF
MRELDQGMLVSQSVLVLCFALAFGLLAAAVVANSTLARTQKSRAFRVTAFAVAIVIMAWAPLGGGLRVNFTASMPLGAYRLVPLPKKGIRRGMFVVTCAPLDAAKLGRHRGYLSAGTCPANTEPLLKAVAAVAGDAVAISDRGVVVNRCLLPHSRPLRFDAAGRRLLPWSRGRYSIRRGQLWLYADNPESWDSRYWGPVPVHNVLAAATAVLKVFSGPVLGPVNRHLCGALPSPSPGGLVKPRFRYVVW